MILIKGDDMKNIKGYEGVYLVTQDGKVWSNRSQRFIGSDVKNSYTIVDLRKNNKQNIKTVHRLVAEAFIPNPKNLREVNHKDGNKHNNHISNLEWVSSAQNTKHGWDNGLLKNEGLVKARRKLTPKQVEEIRKRYKPRCKINGTRALGREYNISQSQISNIINNKERIKNEHI